MVGGIVSRARDTASLVMGMGHPAKATILPIISRFFIMIFLPIQIEVFWLPEAYFLPGSDPRFVIPTKDSAVPESVQPL